MIICPACHRPITEEVVDIQPCTNCGWSVTEKSGALFFAEERSASRETYDPEKIHQLRQQENVHFWFHNRSEYILGLFNKYVAHDAAIIDVGAGTGSIAGELISRYKNVAVGELHESGLKYAKQYGITNLYQFDLENPPFSQHFDAVGMFDVLEHFENDVDVLRKVYGMLRPGGVCILTVPAYSWLWSLNDERAHHRRRYIKRTLRQAAIEAQFSIVTIQYFFFAILPLLYLRSVLNPAKPKAGKAHCQNGELPGTHINPVINTLLDYICKLEFSLARHVPLPAGGSIAAVLRKPGGKI